jgi:hypothetical protein
MENAITYIPQSNLLVKYDTWSDYKRVGEIPNNFLNLVKLFSAQLYPNNFSVSFLDTNFNINCIDNENKYNEIVYMCKGELKLMINIFKEHNKSSKKLKYYCEIISEENSSGFSSNCDSGKKLTRLRTYKTHDFRLDSSISPKAKNKSKTKSFKKDKGSIECY